MVTVSRYRVAHVNLGMSSLPWWGASLLGLFGGLIAELASVNQHRRTLPGNRPGEWGTKLYWWLGGAWVAVGGVLAALWTLMPPGVGVIVAINVGASAPLIVERLLKPGNSAVGTVDTDTAAAA